MFSEKDKSALRDLETGDVDGFLNKMDDIPGGMDGWAERALQEHLKRREQAVRQLVLAANPAKFLDVEKPLKDQDPNPLFEALNNSVEQAFDLGSISIALEILDWLKRNALYR